MNKEVKVNLDSSRAMAPLREALSTAVPLWILVLQDKSFDYIRERALMCGEVIAAKGDNILFKSKKKGETAEAFNRLAEAIACLAFCPGGVNFLGLHFEAEHEEITKKQGDRDA